MITNTEKNWATLTHLGAFGQYLFPLGNFVIPIIIWSSKKNESAPTNAEQSAKAKEDYSKLFKSKGNKYAS